MKRLRTAALLVVAVACLDQVHSGPAGAAASHSVRVSLHITGGYHERVVLSGKTVDNEDGCSVVSFTKTAAYYFLGYHVPVFRDELPLPAMAVWLTFGYYRAGRRTYTGPKSPTDRLDVVLGHHHFFGGYDPKRPGVRMTAVVAPDGRSGHFLASGLAARHGPRFSTMTNDSYTVTITGSWSCDQLRLVKR
jgi:hypothetical protein